MKTIGKFLFLFLFSFAITSCGGDDDNGSLNVSKRNKDVSYPHEIPLIGNHNPDETSIVETTIITTIYLKDILDEDIEKNLTNATFNSLRSYFKISGLSNFDLTAEIRNIRVAVGGKTYQLGTCVVAKGDDSLPEGYFRSDSELPYEPFESCLKKIFETYTSGEKKAEIKITFQPTVDLKASDGVKIEFNIKGIYEYNVYSNK